MRVSFCALAFSSFLLIFPGCGERRTSPPSVSTHPPISFSFLPVDGPIRRPEGEFGAPRKNGTKTHRGIDLLARRGTPVRAVYPGIVVYNEMNGTMTEGYGFTLIIDHMNDYYTLYAHLDSRPSLEIDGYVEAGDIIGRIGHSGNAAGLDEGVRDQVHFEVIHAPSGMLDYMGIRIIDAVSPKTITTLREIAEANYGERGGCLNPLHFYDGTPAYAEKIF